MILVSCDGEQFPCHAGVVAAVSGLLRLELENCDRGIYTVITSFCRQDIEALVRFAYTGDTSDVSTRLIHDAHMELLPDRSEDGCHAKLIISTLQEFANRVLFCNVGIFHAGGVQPSLSYLFAADYTFLSQDIKNESIVTVL